MSEKEGPKFMRFVVRPDCQGGIVGRDFGLFREGVVYEVRRAEDDPLAAPLGTAPDDYVVRELGPSPLGMPLKEALAVGGFSNGSGYDRLNALGGAVLQTVAEKREADEERPRWRHRPG